MCTLTIFAQTDWVKWGKSEISYSNYNVQIGRDHSFGGDNLPELVVKSLASVYWLFISDVDGDNCPFRPSCSGFFIQAVKETNFPQGILMFFDRFTRDMNILNRSGKYPRFGSHYYYDPVTLYTLDENKIHYLPYNTFIKSE